MRRRFSFILLGLWLSLARTAAADDLAEEADLLFRRGADAYGRGEYEAALERFLASNRLVPNHNVAFNIAYTYLQLGRYPEAFRYFTEIRSGERDPAQLSRIDQAIERIRRHVSVLSLETEPAGATLYLDRVDLGARGRSPRRLGVAPGTYRVIAELAGHHSASVEVRALRVGEERRVRLTLKAVTGRVQIDGKPGTEVRTAARQSAPECTVPCDLEFVPGPRTLWLSRPGARATELSFEVEAQKTIRLNAQLQALRGTLLVTTDEAGARVELEGRTVGFTPFAVDVPVGSHRVRVSKPGYRSEEQLVVVPTDAEAKVSLVLTQEEQVTAVSRAEERVREAPSSVTIVPAEELRAFRYPTLAEALRGVPGIYVSDDRSYTSVGIRGVSELGSYGNRVLVLSDGQPLNDNWVGSSYVGYDGRADLGDVDRLEVVRGPGSVVHGNSAFSGVINVVTRPYSARPRVEAGVGAEGDGVLRARVRAEAPLGASSGIWASAAMARGSGRDFYFPEFAATPPAFGHARGVDDFDAATLQGRAQHGVLSVQWFWTTHEKELPTGVYTTVLGDPRAHQRDDRALLELRAEPRILPNVTWLSRLHGNMYRFHGSYPREAEEGGLETDTYRGAWIGLEQRLEITPQRNLRIFVGGELQSHFQVDQLAMNERGVLLDETGDRGRNYGVGAAYASVDARPSSRLSLHAGARLDAYSTFGSAINPRFSAVYRPYDAGNLKLIAGKAFRAPSVYELYYNDGGLTQIQSPELGPEHIYSLELEFAHKFNPLVSANASVFGNYVADLVASRGEGTSADPIHYVNSSVPLATTGAELGLRRDLRSGAFFQASYGFLLARNLSDRSADALLAFEANPDSRHVPNVPTHLFMLKGMFPVAGKSLRIASRFTAESGRYDRYDQEGDPAQQHTRAALLWDVVLTGTVSPEGVHHPLIDWALGIYNVADYRYSAPVSSEFVQRTIPQTGRTLLLSADVAF